MPRRKGQTEYKRGKKKEDSFTSVPDGKIRRYEVDAEDLAQTAADLAAGKINQEMEVAKAEVERRQRISAANKATRQEGRLFEEAILRACEVYKANGTAVINKVPEARRVIGRTGGRSSMMICVNDKKSDPDFEGALAPGGKCIIFDAKATKNKKLSKTALTEHQREIMDAHFACGSDCYMAISFDFKRFFFIPYALWRDMKGIFGRQYILPEDEAIQEYEVPFELVSDKKGGTVYTVWFLGKPKEKTEDPDAPILFE